MKLKIATWNVNSITPRLEHIEKWVKEADIDILCVQEIKTIEEKYPYEKLKELGYESIAFGQKTYNGVAIIAKKEIANFEKIQKNIPEFEDESARLISTELTINNQKIKIINTYFVNGQAPETEKFKYKLNWLEALTKYLKKETQENPNLILLGDFNVTASDEDSYDPAGLADTIHHTIEEREHFKSLIALGLIDTYREFEQPAKAYTWWDYRQLGFQKNRGLRIDYILASSALKNKLISCEIDRAPRKWQRPSDHTPVVLTLDL